MAVFSRDPREHWLKPHFSKNEVANSGYIKNGGGVHAPDNRVRAFILPRAGGILI